MPRLFMVDGCFCSTLRAGVGDGLPPLARLVQYRGRGRLAERGLTAWSFHTGVGARAACIATTPQRRYDSVGNVNSAALDSA